MQLHKKPLHDSFFLKHCAKGIEVLCSNTMRSFIVSEITKDGKAYMRVRRTAWAECDDRGISEFPRTKDGAARVGQLYLLWRIDESQ